MKTLQEICDQIHYDNCLRNNSMSIKIQMTVPVIFGEFQKGPFGKEIPLEAPKKCMIDILKD